MNRRRRENWGAAEKSKGKMTDDEIVTLGSFCQTLMCHSAWAVVVEQFEQHCFQHIMTMSKRSVRAPTLLLPSGRRRLRTLMTNSLGPLMIPKTMTSLHPGDVPACAQAHLVNPKTGGVLFHTARRGHAELSPFLRCFESRGEGSTA